METPCKPTRANGGRALETFLVEWKQGEPWIVAKDVADLETFLVEWKRSKGSKPRTSWFTLKPS